jgi:hypothetical protein
MLRASLATAVMVLAAVPAAGQQAGPKGPPPKFMVAQVDKAGQPFIHMAVTEYVAVKREVTVKVANGFEKRVVQEMVPQLRETRVNLDDAKTTVFDGQGKRIEPKDVRKRIRAMTAVLVSTDGKPVDPFFLRLVRADAVVLVAPELARGLDPLAMPLVLPAPAPPPPKKDIPN